MTLLHGNRKLRLKGYKSIIRQTILLKQSQHFLRIFLRVLKSIHNYCMYVLQIQFIQRQTDLQKLYRRKKMSTVPP